MNTKMNTESKKHIYRFFWQILVSVVTILPFIYVWNTSLNTLLRRSFMHKGNLLMWIIYIVLLWTFMYVFNGFQVGLGRKAHLLIGQWIAYTCLNVVEVMITILMVGRVKHIGEILLGYGKVYLVQLVLLILLTNFGTDLYRKVIPAYRMLNIVGTHENNLDIRLSGYRAKYKFDQTISCDENIDEIKEAILQYDAILLNDLPDEIRNQILKFCFEKGKRVYFPPKISDIIIKSSDDLNLVDTPLYICKNTDISIAERFLKRLMDIVISLTGIILTSPIMLITAICIYAYDRGPVLYKQVRCTKGNREFEICKFRSMVVNAEQDGKAQLAKENDSRITPVGKVIRSMRIDELPQFFNILKGDMSVVGPRPERPELIKKNCKKIPEFAYRTRVKAGLTGYAQIYGKYNTSFIDKLKLDLIYVSNYSILMDIHLIFLTLKIIFIKDSTEGV
ncbi:MAG: exopolysaccharide biosynthesis polyprenyl glycosylphosphotransferase [Firmicutes bacterium]|nr:exopolysaccharide biosynthesis polyprenyl glycosylphosphotransferase [Bacillota bacterium]MDY3769501.1 exopolysaccharide biosynthesis polyprenyl glycosylphosphotransferase [Lachnospiraceae bacterium]